MNNKSKCEVGVPKSLAPAPAPFGQFSLKVINSDFLSIKADFLFFYFFIYLY